MGTWGGNLFKFKAGLLVAFLLLWRNSITKAVYKKAFTVGLLTVSGLGSTTFMAGSGATGRQVWSRGGSWVICWDNHEMGMNGYDLFFWTIIKPTPSDTPLIRPYLLIIPNFYQRRTKFFKHMSLWRPRSFQYRSRISMIYKKYYLLELF